MPYYTPATIPTPAFLPELKPLNYGLERLSSVECLRGICRDWGDLIRLPPENSIVIVAPGEAPRGYVKVVLWREDLVNTQCCWRLFTKTSSHLGLVVFFFVLIGVFIPFGYCARELSERFKQEFYKKKGYLTYCERLIVFGLYHFQLIFHIMICLYYNFLL